MVRRPERRLGASRDLLVSRRSEPTSLRFVFNRPPSCASGLSGSSGLRAAACLSFLSSTASDFLALSLRLRSRSASSASRAARASSSALRLASASRLRFCSSSATRFCSASRRTRSSASLDSRSARSTASCALRASASRRALASATARACFSSFESVRRTAPFFESASGAFSGLAAARLAGAFFSTFSAGFLALAPSVDFVGVRVRRFFVSTTTVLLRPWEKLCFTEAVSVRRNVNGLRFDLPPSLSLVVSSTSLLIQSPFPGTSH